MNHLHSNMQALFTFEYANIVYIRICKYCLHSNMQTLFTFEYANIVVFDFRLSQIVVSYFMLEIIKTFL